MSDVLRTVINLAPGDEVELVLEPCGCAPSHVCPEHDAFAPLCPRRRVADRYLVMRGTAAGARYVHKLLPVIGEAVWTADRRAAHRFIHRSEATYVQGCIVARDGGSAAVVPETPNERAAGEAMSDATS